jgi:acyl-CoA thioesterase FadM
MIPYATYARLAATSLIVPSVSPLDELRLSMRVSAFDVELTRMNNGRYVTLMDTGRIGLALRCGLLASLIKNRWAPLVAAVSIRYRRSLRLGQRYELVTRLTAFDEKFWYFDQRFESEGKTYASAFVKGVFHGPHGSVPTKQMLAAASFSSLESPPIPPAIQAWLDSDDRKSSEK